MREAQRQLGAKNDFVHLMSTVGIVGYGGVHFHAEGYVRMAEQLLPVVAEHGYGSVPEAPVSLPNIVKATYGNAAKTRVVLQFDQQVVLEDGAISLIKLGGTGDLIISGSARGNTITVELSGAPASDTVTYGDASMKDRDNDPLIRGKNGIAALTFWKVPVVRRASK